MNADLANDKLFEPGLELECSLNRLTAQAELAVQDSDPVQHFLRSRPSHEIMDKTDRFGV